MKMSQIVKRVTERHSLVMIRIKPDFKFEKGIPIQYDVRGWTESDDGITEDEELTHTNTRNKKGWILLDAFSASGLYAMFKALSPEMQEKFDRLGLNTLLDVMWKNCK